MKPNLPNKSIRTATLAATLSAMTLLMNPVEVFAKKGGGKPGGGGGGGSDTTPPAQITDLVAFNDVNSGHFITLQWTTVGDDGNTGTASSYELRYSTASPTGFADPETWWDAATIYVLPPRSPQNTSLATGDTQYSTVRFLAPNTVYYVGMKVSDEAGNTAPVSNIASVSTADADWIIEEVTSASLSDFDFEFDPIDGAPSVAFVDRSSGTLSLVQKRNSMWTESTIGGILDPEKPNLEFDHSLIPSIGFHERGEGLMFSIWNTQTASWDLENVFPQRTTYFGFNFDSLDRPCFTYFSVVGKGRNAYKVLNFAYRTSAGWQYELVDDTLISSSGNNQETGLAISPDGTAWIAYTDDLASGRQVLNIASKKIGSATAWHLENVTEADSIWSTVSGIPWEIAISPVTGLPSVAYFSESVVTGNRQLSVASLNDNQWIVDVVDSSGTTFSVSWPTIDINNQGQILVSYVRDMHTFSPYLKTMMAAVGDIGGDWTLSAVDRGELGYIVVATDPVSGGMGVTYIGAGVSNIPTLYLARPVQP